MGNIGIYVERCRFNQPFFQWCIGFAAAEQWCALSAPFETLLRHTFSSWLQTRINEKANKVFREAENVDSRRKAHIE